MSGIPRGGIPGEGDRQAGERPVAAAPGTRPAARAALAAARTPADLFPADDAAAVRLHRRLARLLHPDTVPEPERAGAEAEFARLETLWRRRTATTLTTRHRTYTLGPVVSSGDLAVLRAASYDHDGTRHRALLKIPRAVTDNDLMEREARALNRLARRGAARHRVYAPRLMESFRHRDPDSGVERRVNCLARMEGWYSLAEVRAAHTDGLDPRDAAWMWRRLLVALGWAHRTGLVHGAVLPDHVLIHPERHGLVLVDWCYSTALGDRVPALVERHRDSYPPEVTGRRPATEATDIHLASRTLAALMGDRTPPSMRAFLRGCTLPAEARRPHDAWRLLAELDELLDRLYGPRTFRPFTMPAAAPGP
ncbi:molecular chaperone DnaJ [Streptomyces gilvosporeus]|uniref:Molecular chaperone DnaJ n=1 Tax=Streptomyces gilvosporeus TaxID=553510 RepID=A0A1V0TMM0_9ACTN|nr:molecular chaperone DnaJ [Streptomyces gilvosporeus]ARF54100.1 molecular chaperone DnaJ [Streptomyces gilvosporeus]